MFLRLTLLALVVCALGLGQCMYQINPTGASFSNSSNDSVINVAASASSCAWTSRSNTSWITISYGQTGTGNGSVGFTITQNNMPSQRAGSLTIAGLTFNVTQAAAACSYSLSPTGASVPSTGGTGSLGVNTACTWTATSNNADWLTVTGTGSAAGTAQYTALPNSTGAARTGTISIGTQTFTVTQSAPCTFTLSPFSIQADPTAGGTGTFTVTASANTCSWAATSANPDFIAVTSGQSGTGNGSVGYSVQPNRSTSARAGSISVGSTSFTVYQPGGPACAYGLSPGSASFPATGGASSFSVTTTCSWTPLSNSGWISITSAGATGNGTVAFNVANNASSGSRSGTILIGSQPFTVTQSGVACAVTASPVSFRSPATGLPGSSVDVGAPDGCSWAVTAPSWISLGTANGTGNGVVPFSVAANSTAQVRTGTIAIANQTVTVTEDAADCSQMLSPTSASIPAGGGNYSVNIATPCAYMASSNAGWVKILSNASGIGTADIGYAVAANTGADARAALLTIGTQAFAISQSGAGCALTISPGTASIGGRGGSGMFEVNATASCRWQPSADQDWIHNTFAAVNGNGRVTYTVDRNQQQVSRSGRISVADQTFQITQGGREPASFTAAGLLNAASFQSGSVAPGEVITLFGSGMGPDRGVALQLSGDGQTVLSAVADTRVLFDGNPAALLYVSEGQVSAIVPYEISGQATTQVQVETNGLASDPVTLNVAGTSPALFTVDASGRGPGAILNQNSTVNSATNPARKGTIVVLFGTGEGQTAPEGVDGAIASTSKLAKPLAPVRVAIGGVNATVTYAGSAPGLPEGVLQVNVQIPAAAPSGAVPVVLTIGNASSRSDVTVAVQ